MRRGAEAWVLGLAPRRLAQAAAQTIQKHDRTHAYWDVWRSSSYTLSSGGSRSLSSASEGPGPGAAAEQPAVRVHSVLAVDEGQDAFASATVTFFAAPAPASILHGGSSTTTTTSSSSGSSSGSGSWSNVLGGGGGGALADAAAYAAQVALLAVRGALGSTRPPTALVAMASAGLPPSALRAAAAALAQQAEGAPLIGLPAAAAAEAAAGGAAEPTGDHMDTGDSPAAATAAEPAAAPAVAPAAAAAAAALVVAPAAAAAAAPAAVPAVAQPAVAPWSPGAAIAAVRAPGRMIGAAAASPSPAPAASPTGGVGISTAEAGAVVQSLQAAKEAKRSLLKGIAETTALEDLHGVPEHMAGDYSYGMYSTRVQNTVGVPAERGHMLGMTNNDGLLGIKDACPAWHNTLVQFFGLNGDAVHARLFKSLPLGQLTDGFTPVQSKRTWSTGNNSQNKKPKQDGKDNNLCRYCNKPFTRGHKSKCAKWPAKGKGKQSAKQGANESD